MIIHIQITSHVHSYCSNTLLFTTWLFLLNWIIRCLWTNYWQWPIKIFLNCLFMCFYMFFLTRFSKVQIKPSLKIQISFSTNFIRILTGKQWITLYIQRSSYNLVADDLHISLVQPNRVRAPQNANYKGNMYYEINLCLEFRADFNMFVYSILTKRYTWWLISLFIALVREMGYWRWTFNSSADWDH